MHLFLIFLMLASGCGFAQAPRPARKKAAPPPPATQWPIQSLAVEGNHTYTAAQVLAVAGLKIGQMAGKPEFEAARGRLVATGAFETVGYKFEPASKGSGYTASFQVTEVQPVYPVEFEEMTVPDADLTALLHSKDPLFSMAAIPATKPVLDRYVSWIEEYLASKGKPEKIAARVVSTSTDKYEVLVRPARNRPSVAEVTFEGNQVVPQSVLRAAISEVGIGLLFTEAGFRELLDNAVRPVYEARGRLRVAWTKIRIEAAPDVQGLHVFVTVDEGQSYTLGKVAIEGATPVPSPQLLKAGDFKSGDVANFDRINEGLERMRKSLRHAGYLEAKAATKRRIDDAKKTVDLAVTIDPGPLFTMGKLVIKGLDLDGEAEIVRIWTLKEGKPFNPDYPDFFLGRVKEQAMFDNLGATKSETQIDAKTHIVNVTLNFSGGEPGRGPGRRGGRGL
jgi:outer membrane protein assembly factor BamA